MSTAAVLAPLFAHVLGYVGEVSELQLSRQDASRPMQSGDIVGLREEPDRDWAIAVVRWLNDHGYDGWAVVEQDVLPGLGTPKESARRNREYLAWLGT